MNWKSVKPFLNCVKVNGTNQLNTGTVYFPQFLFDPYRFDCYSSATATNMILINGQRKLLPLHSIYRRRRTPS